MAMLKNEIEVLKAVAMKVDDDHIMLATLQYHTEKTDQGKRNKEKSLYRWFAKVMSIADWKARIEDLFSDAKRLEKYVLPNDNIGLDLCINKSTTNYSVADWLQTKINKTISWEDGQKHFRGWKKKTLNRPEGYNPKAAYDTIGYLAENGDLVDLTDKDALLKHVNQNLTKRMVSEKMTNKIV